MSENCLQINIENILNLTHISEVKNKSTLATISYVLEGLKIQVSQHIKLGTRHSLIHCFEKCKMF